MLLLINNMTCLIHVYYCLVVLVTIPDNLSAIMLPVYFVTLSDTCYTFCYGTLFMSTYTLHTMYFLFHIFFVHASFLYTHDIIARLLMSTYTLHTMYFLFHIFFVHASFLYTHDIIARLFMFSTDTVRLLFLLV